MNIHNLIADVEYNEKYQIGTLVGDCLRRDIVRIRQIIMYLLRKYTPLSYREIGECFNRDHSTAMYAFTQIENDLKIQDEITVKKYEDIYKIFIKHADYNNEPSLFELIHKLTNDIEELKAQYQELDKKYHNKYHKINMD